MARGTATGRQASTLPSCTAGGPNTLLRYRASRESRVVTATIAAGRQYATSDRSWAVDGAAARVLPCHRSLRYLAVGFRLVAHSFAFPVPGAGAMQYPPITEPGTPVSACQRITVGGETGTTSTRASLASRSRAKACCQPAGVGVTADACRGSGMMGTTARATSATAAALRQAGARAGTGGSAAAGAAGRVCGLAAPAVTGAAASAAGAPGAGAAAATAGLRARLQARSREKARTA